VIWRLKKKLSAIQYVSTSGFACGSAARGKIAHADEAEQVVTSRPTNLNFSIKVKSVHLNFEHF
jgi:hypothetical protein